MEALYAATAAALIGAVMLSTSNRSPFQPSSTQTEYSGHDSAAADQGISSRSPVKPSTLARTQTEYSAATNTHTSLVAEVLDETRRRRQQDDVLRSRDKRKVFVSKGTERVDRNYGRQDAFKILEGSMTKGNAFVDFMEEFWKFILTKSNQEGFKVTVQLITENCGVDDIREISETFVKSTRTQGRMTNYWERARAHYSQDATSLFKAYIHHIMLELVHDTLEVCATNIEAVRKYLDREIMELTSQSKRNQNASILYDSVTRIATMLKEFILSSPSINSIYSDFAKYMKTLPPYEEMEGEYTIHMMINKAASILGPTQLDIEDKTPTLGPKTSFVEFTLKFWNFITSSNISTRDDFKEAVEAITADRGANDIRTISETFIKSTRIQGKMTNYWERALAYYSQDKTSLFQAHVHHIMLELLHDTLEVCATNKESAIKYLDREIGEVTRESTRNQHASDLYQVVIQIVSILKEFTDSNNSMDNMYLDFANYLKTLPPSDTMEGEYTIPMMINAAASGLEHMEGGALDKQAKSILISGASLLVIFALTSFTYH